VVFNTVIAQEEDRTSVKMTIKRLNEARLLELETAADSIAYFRKETKALRKDLNNLVKKLKFDREFIFGENDKYLKEGMHKAFRTAPQSMALTIDRDKKVIELEKKHIQLYHADKALFKWLDIEEQLQKNKVSLFGKIKSEKIKANYFRLEDRYKVALQKEKVLMKWLQNELKKQLFPATQITNASVKPEKALEFLKPEEGVLERNRLPQGSYPKVFSDDLIIASYPFPGQFNFYIHELNRNVGYFLFKRFPKEIDNLLWEKRLAIRWKNQAGDLLYSLPAYGFATQVLAFSIPTNFLEPEELYELAIVTLPEGAELLEGNTQYYQGTASFFEENAKLEATDNIVGEKVVHQLYFRTSRYKKFFTKMEGLKLKAEGDSLRASVSFREPFGANEVAGNYNGNYFMEFSDNWLERTDQVKNIYSTTLAYFLQVPKITEVDTAQLSPIWAARDQTLYSEFIYDLRKGNPKSIKKIEKKDTVRIGEQYTIAPFPIDRIYILQDFKAPKITAAHFSGEKELGLNQKSYQADLVFPGLLQMKAIEKEVELMIRKRMKERAQYLFLIDTWRRKQEGQTERLSLSYWEKQEVQNLPEILNNILEKDLSNPSKDKVFFFHAYYKLPALSTRTSIVRTKVEFK
jgi:hypothetical protein